MPTFEGELIVESNGDGYVIAPSSVVTELGAGRARIPIVGSVLGHGFRSSTRPLGDGRHGVRVYKVVRLQHGLHAGDQVEVEVERDLNRWASRHASISTPIRRWRPTPR